MGTEAVLSKSRVRWQGMRIDLLWPLIILAGLGFYTALVPLPPNDFWWHLKIGELIYVQRAIPDTNLFAWTLPADYPFVYGAWLGELLFYVLYRWGGLALISVVRTAMALGAFGLVGVEARRRSGSWRLAALAIAGVGLMSINNLIIRPQNWSWLPFMAYVILLGRYADGQLRARWLAVLPLLMVFWVNAHGAFILGLTLIGVFFVGEAARTALRLPGARSWAGVGVLAGVGAATGAATLINPRFWQIVSYVIDLLTDQPSQSLVVEWQSPTPGGIPNTTFFVVILVLMLLLVYSRYRPSPSDWLMILGFLWLAWSGQRYVVWFGMIALPILVQALQGVLPMRAPSAPAARNWLNVAIAGLLFVPLVMVLPWWVERFPLPPQYWSMVVRGASDGALLGVETPVQATAYLKAHPGGRLFNEMGYGSYLIWAVPDQGVFVDSRVELYPFEQWEDYVRISAGARYNALLTRYGADRILLDLKLQAGLAEALNGDPLWEKEYEDSRSQIWRRKPAP